VKSSVNPSCSCGDDQAKSDIPIAKYNVLACSQNEKKECISSTIDDGSDHELSNLFNVSTRPSTTSSLRQEMETRFQNCKIPIPRSELLRLCQRDSIFVRLKEYTIIKKRLDTIVDTNSDQRIVQHFEMPVEVVRIDTTFFI
jgi:hypothetical protein